LGGAGEGVCYVAFPNSALFSTTDPSQTEYALNATDIFTSRNAKHRVQPGSIRLISHRPHRTTVYAYTRT
jgi:hypothetical protein